MVGWDPEKVSVTVQEGPDPNTRSSSGGGDVVQLEGPRVSVEDMVVVPNENASGEAAGGPEVANKGTLDETEEDVGRDEGQEQPTEGPAEDLKASQEVEAGNEDGDDRKQTSEYPYYF
jgi:hypothetical protein